MYIPTIFFGDNNSCIQLSLTGSTFPSGSNTNNNVTYGQISGSQSYFWIKVPEGNEFTFELRDGITNGKLLLVGGGGGAFAFETNPLNPSDGNTGGGAGGLVLYQDIPLSPGLYFMSASSYDPTTLDGGTSFFRKSNDGISMTSSYVELSAQGGGSSQLGVGGSNAWFSGGNPTSQPGGAGGGGAGSTSNGTDATRVTNFSIPGSGGNGFTIPDSVLEPAIGTLYLAAGGCGNSFSGNTATQCAPQSLANRNEWGSGANGSNPTDRSGQKSLAMLFIPINSCQLAPTGAVVLPRSEELIINSQANIQGTFVSGSDTFAYHIFTSSGRFQVESGTPTDAKIIAVGGGAGGQGTSFPPLPGGAGAGRVSIKRNINLYGTYNISVGAGGAASQNGGNSGIEPVSTFITYMGANGGGEGASITENASSGGSGGGGASYFSSGVPVTKPPGISVQIGSPFDNFDETYGNSGGPGYRSGDVTQGGGGGGAGSAGTSGNPSLGNGVGGSGYTLTGEFFPSGVFLGLSEIAKGGSRFGATDNGQPANSGNGGYGNSAGASGFVCITYKVV
jgi:hypothetical protein